MTTTEPPVALFELHLLESGISGLGFKARLGLSARFELHLLESGISGNLCWHSKEAFDSLNSTYWNLVFQVKYIRDMSGKRDWV